MRVHLDKAWWCLGLLALVALSATAVEMAETMSLKAEGGENAPVTFEHRLHAMNRGIPCMKCHHNMDKVGTPKCAPGCHTLAGQEGVLKLEEAFHKNCWGCHQSPPKGKAPPTECAQCHVKKSS